MESSEALGGVRSAISRELTRLHASYYGHGPTRARTVIAEDVVVVVLEETFTRMERTLVARGDVESIKEIRRNFQQHMKEEFIAVVEQATGRKVRAFLSDTHVEEDVSVEFFLLYDERTDMSSFEEAGGS